MRANKRGEAVQAFELRRATPADRDALVAMYQSDARVTDVDSSFDGNPNGPGDYSGIACLGSSAHPYFADHRDANILPQSGTAGAFEIYSAIKP